MSVARFTLKHWSRSVGRYALPVLLLLSCGCSSLPFREDTGERLPGKVELVWSGTPELEGFNLYRRTRKGKDTRVNEEPIKPIKESPDNRTMENYRYVDYGVSANQDYYYTLEEIRPDGSFSKWDSPWKMTAEVLVEDSP